MPSPSVALDTFATFGDLLKFLRRRARLTQLELSIAVGYSEAQISRLEKNQRLPDLTALQALFLPALHLEDESDLTARLLSLAESARQEDAPSPGIAPYKGLLFFDEADTDLFFGREVLTTRLADQVQALPKQSPRLLAIVGASGSGKSSIARAGLAVAMKRNGRDVHVFTPTAQPIKMLEANLENVPRVLVIDQFEEVFTLCRDEKARAEFIDRLLALANYPNQTTIVIALRADFYSHCAQYPALRQAIAAHQEYIGQMTRKELRSAIEEPAKRGGWEFEPGLVDLMLNDVGIDSARDQEPGALPLLSHALLATWERRRGRIFTFAGYRAAGGVRRAIAETAENVFTDQLNEPQQHLARDIFLRLTELGEGTEDTRRRAGLTELVPRADQAAQLRAVLNTLAEARLVMVGQDSAEVAHEALIREWQRLREWLNENREGLRMHRHLTEAAQSWDKLSRDEGELYRGARLAQALEWAEAHWDELNPLEREFIAVSRELHAREEKEHDQQRQRELEAAKKLTESSQQLANEQRHRANLLRWVALGATVLAVVMIGLVVFASSQRQDAIAQRDTAENEGRIAFARELSVNSVANLDVDPERSILLAFQAVSVNTAGGKPVLLEAEEALHRAVQTSRVQLTLRGHTAGVTFSAVSPDGKRLATASLDRTAKVWDLTNGKELLTLSGHTAELHGVAYSLDGTRLATASFDKTAKVWDATTGKELLTLSGHTDQVYSVAFSPDGTRLATASLDKTAKVWDAATGKELLTLSGHTASIRQVVFSPDGKRVVTASEDKTAKIWDTATGKELLTLSGHTLGVWNVAFNPDGTRIATGSQDGIVRIWDASSAQQLMTLRHQNTSIDGLVFNSDGTRLVMTGGDGIVIVWDVATGQTLLELHGHTSSVGGPVFIPNSYDTRLATASNDMTARVWDISPAGQGEWLNLAGHNGRVRDIAYSQDGTRLVTAGADKTAKVWDATTGKELLTLIGHTDEVRGVAISPDARRIATISDDKSLKMWDADSGKVLFSMSTQVDAHGFTDHSVAFSPDGKRVAVENAGNTVKILDSKSGEELLMLSGHTDMLHSIVYSPDGRRIATSSTDKTAKVWDAATGKELLTLSGHASKVYTVVFSLDGTRLATASPDGTAKVWDAKTGKELFTLSGHTAIVASVACSPDGTRVATASFDQTVKIWDISTTRQANEQPLTLFGPVAEIYRVVFSPDGKRIATANRDGIARVYALPLEDIIAIAKSRVTRTLTTDECQKFLHMNQCLTDPRPSTR